MKTDETNFIRNPAVPAKPHGTPALDAIQALSARDPGTREGARESDAFDRWRGMQARNAKGDADDGPADAYREAALHSPLSEGEPHAGVLDVASIHGLDPDALSGPIAKVLAELTHEVADLNEALQAAAHRIERLESQVEEDSLTGLHDHGGLLHEIAHVRSLDQREQSESAVALMDVVETPDIRRRFGRPAMEALISHVADALSKECPPGEILAHLGEGEFALILPGRPPDAAAERVREILGSALAAPFRWAGQDHALSATVGVASAAKGEDAQAILAGADRDLRAG
jgi:diguanylate cyclase (GGDEF)-like protein